MLENLFARNPLHRHPSPMSTKMIERELAEVKQRLAKLEATVARKPGQAWREIIGTLKPDDLSREAARLGAEYRAKQNKRK